MHNDTDQITQVGELLKYSQAALGQCEQSYKGFQTFRGNNGRLVFYMVQLQQSAAELRGYADALVAIAGDLHATERELPEQLELHVVEMNGRP